MDKYVKAVRLFPEKEKTLNEIRAHLKKFIGGSVKLSKTDDGLAVVTLNHEERKNAMSGKMMVDLLDVVEELESWNEGKGVIMYGSGGNFCSGGDLNFARATGTAEEGFMMSTLMHNALNRFQRLPLISVAVVEGIGALGGGAELSLASDYRVISESCQGIGFVHGRMGLIPAWGGASRLVQRVGFGKALEALSTAKIMNPKECLQIGLVDDIIPEGEDAFSYAVTWIKDKTKFSPSVVRGMKAVTGLARDFGDSFEMERRVFAPFWGSSGNKEALSKNIKHKADNSGDG